MGRAQEEGRMRGLLDGIANLALIAFFVIVALVIVAVVGWLL